jgi:hypothetical protein
MVTTIVGFGAVGAYEVRYAPTFSQDANPAAPAHLKRMA